MHNQGITSAEASVRLAQFGLNQIYAQKDRSVQSLFFAQFKSPLVLILLFACVLSIFVGEIVEASGIGAILFLNALIGFYQEYRAETAIAALIQMTAPRARVFRDGKLTEVLAVEVVPGDLLSLEAGNVVAADAVILESAKCQTNEAILTGESLPVPKQAEGNLDASAISDRDGVVFMGTVIVGGTAVAEVKATGMKTELGKIAHLLSTIPETATPLQTQLAHIGRTLLFTSLGVMGAVVVIGLLKHQTTLEVFIFALSLAVACVPEGMPAIVTVALAMGVRRMAERNALIRRLSSVETLGSVSVICTDKTGTLTTSQMRVRELWGADHKSLLNAAASCCDSDLPLEGFTDLGDPTELAILIAARERGIEKAQIEIMNPRIKTDPFDTETRIMTVQRADGKKYVKGAIESVLPLCASDATTRNVGSAVLDMTSRGLRVLAIAEGDAEKLDGLVLLGLIGIADPPRTEVAQAIQEARNAGIISVMITGDHPSTAIAVAREVGLILEHESAEERVHARAKPEDKLQLVRDWKKKGAIVAMTGDGVNDAPALREAHIGIAMGKSGTQVTRQSADLVLADDNFATIIAAVKEGRGIYRNIRKTIVYLLIGNFAELVLVFSAAILNLPIPFLAVHLLWINLVTDALPALALIADPTGDDVMMRPPRSPSERILGSSEWARIIVVGSLEALSIGILYWIQLQKTDLDHARDLAFTALVASELFRSFSARSPSKTHWQFGILTNGWILGIVAGTLGLQIGIHYIPFFQLIFKINPISLNEIFWLLPFSLLTVSAEEGAKLIRDYLTKT